jgi:hypothetical protein
MTPKLKRYINRTILVSIPSLFKHGKCKPYTLQAIETEGLWLSSPTLVDHLLPEADRGSASNSALVFVANTHIAALILPPMASIASATNANETKTGAPETATPVPSTP